jgi:hypothetical protein
VNDQLNMYCISVIKSYSSDRNQKQSDVKSKWSILYNVCYLLRCLTYSTLSKTGSVSEMHWRKALPLYNAIFTYSCALFYTITNFEFFSIKNNIAKSWFPWPCVAIKVDLTHAVAWSTLHFKYLLFRIINNKSL